MMIFEIHIYNWKGVRSAKIYNQKIVTNRRTRTTQNRKAGLQAELSTGLRVTVQVVAFLSALLVSQSVTADTITGLAKVVDGDGLWVKGIEHRLHGIDAFEYQQGCKNAKGQILYCGLEAKRTLQSLVRDQQVTCRWTNKDRYGRALSTCFVNDINLNAAMVYTGYAMAYRRYSTEYIPYENKARQNQHGAWKGSFVMPWEHRKSGRKVSVPPPDSNRLIKGNINSKGRYYYHCPGDKSYANTRITEAKGERWFATSTEAETAGWVRPPGFVACRL